MSTIRGFQPADLDALAPCFADTETAVPVTRETIVENVLLDPNLVPGGLAVAIDNADRVEGFIYATTMSGDLGSSRKRGWISIVGVRPDRRRRGIGRLLLGHAETFLSSQGVTEASVSDYAPAYFTPGVDVRSGAAAQSMLLRAGYRVVDSPVAMRRTLARAEAPAELAALIRARKEEGYRFSPATFGDLPELLDVAATRFDGDWADVLRDSVRRNGRPERIVIARDPRFRIVGFATHGSYAGPDSRFGPFGVAPTERGKSLGRILLWLCLDAMASSGLDSAWFLWTDADGAAGRLYRSAGFSVTHRFAILRKTLTVDPTSRQHQGARP